MYECPASCDSLCRAVAGPCLRVLHPACSGLLLTAFTLQLAVPPDSSLLHTAATLRALRWIWQNTDAALTEVKTIKHLNGFIFCHCRFRCTSF